MSTVPADHQAESTTSDRSHWIARKGRLGDPEMEVDWPPSTPEERLAMVWPITIQAWSFKGEDVAKSRLPRHLISVSRRTR